MKQLAMATAFLAACLSFTNAWPQTVGIYHPTSNPPGAVSRTYAGYDGGIVEGVFYPDGRLYSASGRKKDNSFYMVQLTYNAAGISYFLGASTSTDLQLTVTQGKKVALVQSTAGTSAQSTLILLDPIEDQPSSGQELRVYAVPSLPGNRTAPVIKSAVLAGPAQAYPFVGNVIGSNFAAYEDAITYLTPALNDLANLPLRTAAANASYTIGTKLDSYQPSPPRVCATSNVPNNPFGLLVCIGIGIEVGTVSEEPDDVANHYGLIPVGDSGSNTNVQPCLQSSNAAGGHACEPEPIDRH